MANTYDTDTPVGQVRLLISDVGGQDGSSFLFEDKEIETFLSLKADNVFSAAAAALRAIANNEAQVSKRITFLDIKTDGPAVAKELREAATELDQQANDDADFEIATFDVGFAGREMRGLDL